MLSQQEISEILYQTLHHFWGSNDFRDSQKDIIDSIINGKDTIALLPTGAGKSLCYQLPALIQQGMCIVVSPLLALMKDQVNQLKIKGIDAEFISSELEDSEMENIFTLCRDGFVKLLYVSPERLTNNLFIENIREMQISFIAVDEAHCISEWGQDFRPSYQNIKHFKENFKGIPCIALTATATPKVLEEIQQKLGLNNPAIFKKSFKRDNLNIIVKNISDKYKYIYEILQLHQSSGIIYTRTRKDTEELYHYLQSQNFTNVDYYHAGLSTKEKNQKYKKWLHSNKHTLISTNAFGMGINKEDVSLVIHYSPSASIENYYQEIGRAGRNGNQSFAFMLWNQFELNSFDDILANQIPSKEEFLRIISFIYSIFQVADGELPEPTFQLSIERIKNFTKCSYSKIKNVINFLHNQELIYHNDYKILSSLELKISPEDIEFLPPKDAYFIELLIRNLAGLSSHKVHFNETKIANKIGTNLSLFREFLIKFRDKNILDYIDGSLASIKFIKHRNNRLIQTKYWNLFKDIQKNKIQKWEEMKFFTTDTNYCKMKLILTYFGEKNIKNCGKCFVCKRKKESIFGTNISSEILEILEKNPATLDQIAVKLSFHKREKVLENLIELLDSGKVKMLDFRTYTLA